MDLGRPLEIVEVELPQEEKAPSQAPQVPEPELVPVEVDNG